MRYINLHLHYITFLVFVEKFRSSPFNNDSNRKTTKNVLAVSYIIVGFYRKDFTIATIYDKLQRIDLGVSKWTNINTIIKNGEAFAIKQHCIMTSAEAALPTLPNIALNALYVVCLLWLTEHRNTVAYTPIGNECYCTISVHGYLL